MVYMYVPSKEIVGSSDSVSQFPIKRNCQLSDCRITHFPSRGLAFRKKLLYCQFSSRGIVSFSKSGYIFGFLSDRGRRWAMIFPIVHYRRDGLQVKTITASFPRGKHIIT